MKYTQIALNILAAKDLNLIKSNAQFWKEFADEEKFNENFMGDARIVQRAEALSYELDNAEDIDGIVCIYDDNFPVINPNVKNKSEKPYLFFYRGDFTLLENLNNNVAVIGLIDPDTKIVQRERNIINQLVKKNLVIVSGLAQGCDTVAHQICLEAKGKTIAILPSQVNKVVPAENRNLADEIVDKGGLLITEYYKDPENKFEAISRFVERDRLQAMFSKAVILIASYRKDEGDSGSRHAMSAAQKYNVERYAMYNEITDINNKQFGLNKDLIYLNEDNPVQILMPSSIEHIQLIDNPDLLIKEKPIIHEQLKLL